MSRPSSESKEWGSSFCNRRTRGPPSYRAGRPSFCVRRSVRLADRRAPAEAGGADLALATRGGSRRGLTTEREIECNPGRFRAREARKRPMSRISPNGPGPSAGVAGPGKRYRERAGSMVSVPPATPDRCITLDSPTDASLPDSLTDASRPTARAMHHARQPEASRPMHHGRQPDRSSRLTDRVCSPCRPISRVRDRAAAPS